MPPFCRLFTLAIAGCLLPIGLQSVAAQQPTIVPDLRTSQVLGIPSSYCGHVIDLLMVNQMRQNRGIHGFDINAGMMQPHAGLIAAPGDLELLAVHLVADGSDLQGPVIQVTFRNVGDYPADCFRITAVAVLGRIHCHSPSVTIAVRRIDAGATLQLQLQLPAEAMLICNDDGRTPGCPFDTLVVALDSFDELIECNELNNVLILRRDEIAAVVVDAVVPDAELPVDATPPTAVPAPSLPDGRSAIPRVLENEPQPSPLDGLDLDTLETPGSAASL